MTTQILSNVYTVYGLAKALHNVINNLKENDEYENVANALEDDGSLIALSTAMYNLITNGHLVEVEETLDQYFINQEQHKMPISNA